MTTGITSPAPFLYNVSRIIPPQSYRQTAGAIKYLCDIMPFPSASGVVINGGTFISQTNHTSRGIDILMERVATGAFHNSDELYDAPKCHPHTRVAVLDDIMNWVNESESERDEFMLWLFGPAGAGKSAIAKRVAELAAERNLLIGGFFFSRISPTRNTKDRLIATLAYQLGLSIPDTRPHIEDAIERDPAIFNKNILTQIYTLLIKPFLESISSAQIVPTQKLIIIDGLDECNDSQAQVAILEAISRSFPQHNLPIKFLIVSRPEISLVTSFTSQEPLKSIHRRLALDDTYQPDDDIRLFFSDRFKEIRFTHPLRSTIPNSWPTQELLDTLVRKASGQFIYASTVVKFVESSCHRPSTRLNIILGISPPGIMNPFAELDALYNHLFSSVNDIQITLRVLSLYIMMPNLVYVLQTSMPPEPFLSLQPGDTQLALINLSSIVTYDESSGTVKILHASLVDFLSDKRRSTTFYTDMASACANFMHRILQYVRGPDGILAGDVRLFRGLNGLSPWIPKGRLQSEILNFDLDAFINAFIKWKYKGHPFLIPGSTIVAFDIWKRLLDNVNLENRDKREALDRLNKSLESRLQLYQVDWRLQILLTLAVTNVINYARHGIPCCRYLDILLDMDDHDLHLADQHALDLRHAYFAPWFNIIPCVDDDKYALAALHCMSFLSNPPKHSKRNECPGEMSLIYVEWKATCAITLEMICTLLQRANTLPDLVQFISNHDIHSSIQASFPAKYLWEVNVHILVFLSRAGMCPNWRVISAIQSSPIITHQQSSKYVVSDEDEGWATRHFTRQRRDQCCLNIHQNNI